MSEKFSWEKLNKILETRKPGDHAWFLSLLDDVAKKNYEDEHLEEVIQMLKRSRILPHKNAIREMKE